MQYIASVSFGKDSLAMLLSLLSREEKLDEVIFYDTGMEFWCGGRCRWGTTEKNKTISKYLKKNYGEDYKEYVGIAYDEQNRIKNDEHKLYPLIDLNMTERDCLKFCHSQGYYWEEDGIRLYDCLG